MCGDGAGISVRPINGNIRILYTVSVVNDTSTWWSRAWHSRVAGTRAPQRRQTWFSSWISSRTRTHTCPIPWPSDPAENRTNCSIYSDLEFIAWETYASRRTSMHFLASGGDGIVSRWIVNLLASPVDRGHMLLLRWCHRGVNLTLAHWCLYVHAIHMVRLQSKREILRVMLEQMKDLQLTVPKDCIRSSTRCGGLALATGYSTPSTGKGEGEP